MRNHPKRFPLPWLPWMLALVVLAALACGMLLMYHDEAAFYEPTVTLTTEGIPSSKQVQTATRRAGSEPAPLQARVWLDVCPNMVGFINGREGSIESTYRQLLASLKITTARSLDWYWFNNISVGSMTEVGFQDTSKYTDAGVSLSQAHGIGMVLENARLDRETPVVIFTDLESIYREDDYAASLREIQDKLQAQVFELGLCLRVDRYVSAYSGLLEVFGQSSHYVYYGESNTVTAGIPIVKTSAMYFHPQPRAFYVLTIGTAAQCEDIGARIADTYNVYCDGLRAPFDDPKMNLNSYIAHDTMRFYQHAPTQVAKLECTGSAGVHVANPGEGYQFEPIGDNGIVGFCFQRSVTKEGVTAIRLNIASAIELYGSPVAIACDKPVIASLQKLVLTPVPGPDPNNPDQYVECRGGRWARKDLVEAEAEKAALTVTMEAEPDGDYTLQITVDHSLICTGLYRVSIPIFYTPNVAAQSKAYQAQIDGWSLTTLQVEELYRLVSHDEAVPFSTMLKTLNIWDTVSAFNAAYGAVEPESRFQLADIVFEIRIE